MSNILRYQTWLNENRIFEADSSLFIDWKGKLSGAFPKLGLAGEGKRIIGIGAKSGKEDAMGITFGSAAKRGTKWSVITPPKSTPPVATTPQLTPPTITPSVDFKGTDFPYPDNIITPNWTIAQGAKTLFDGFIINLVDYFKLDPTQAKNNFKSIAIEGAADVANATLDVPAGYTKLDHNYGGAKPSNEFLAENRALKMKDAIVKALTANGGLTPELVTFISGKITTTFKTGLPRGGRYVKITTAATPYDVKTAGTAIPATTTPGTETPGQVGPSGETSKTYSVLNDTFLGYFFGDSSAFKIESSAITPFRPDKNGKSDFQKIEISALQNWAKEYLGGELLSSDEVANLTATVNFTENETPVATRPGELSASVVDSFFTVSFNVPAGKVFAPASDQADNANNSIKCSDENSNTLSRYGYGMGQRGMKTGFPFVIFYTAMGDGKSGILELHSVSVGPERLIMG
jgi:hypothetical protein